MTSQEVRTTTQEMMHSPTVDGIELCCHEETYLWRDESHTWHGMELKEGLPYHHITTNTLLSEQDKLLLYI